MKMKDGSTNGRAAMVGTEEREEVDKGQTLTAERAYLSAHPLFSILICKSSLDVWQGCPGKQEQVS